MTNLDKSLNNYITHIKFLNLDAVNYYFITKCHKKFILKIKSWHDYCLYKYIKNILEG